VRNDVPQLLAGLIDVLLLPSLWEGLPITLIESQAAGVPALYSDAITSEAEELPQLLRRVSLRESAASWAVEAVSMAKLPPVIAGRDRLAGSRCDIRACVARLEEVYSSAPHLGAE
jgi:glycosyltransferase involved in cell wall biosynthesis